MLKTEELKDILGHIPLFKGCADQTLKDIAVYAREIDFEKGQIIYEPGEVAANIYVLVDGVVTFINKSVQGLLNDQRVMERSMIFGWVALVPEHPHRLGRAQCQENSKILAINGDLLMGILEKDTESGFLVMKRLSSLIADTFVVAPRQEIARDGARR